MVCLLSYQLHLKLISCFLVHGKILEGSFRWFWVLQHYIVRTYFCVLNSLAMAKTLRSGWDIQDGIYSKELLIANKANGFRDIIATIDLSTYRRISWENNVPFFLVSFFDPDTRQPLCVDPRGVLKTITDRGAAIDRECIAGIEYEVISCRIVYSGR
jgi:glutamine synthetase